MEHGRAGLKGGFYPKYRLQAVLGFLIDKINLSDRLTGLKISNKIYQLNLMGTFALYAMFI